MNVYKICPAVINDLATIVSIYNEAITAGGQTADTKTYSTEEKIDWFQSTNVSQYGIYVLLVQEEVVGYYYFSAWRKNREALKGTVEISYYLSKAFHGQGFGNILLTEALKTAKEKKFHHLLAILLSSNQRSKKLLEKWGFDVVGEMPNVARIDGQAIGQYIMIKEV